MGMLSSYVLHVWCWVASFSFSNLSGHTSRFTPSTTSRTLNPASGNNNIVNHDTCNSSKTTPTPFLSHQSPPSGVTLSGFEGPEKLLEIWFSSSSRPESPDSGLGSGPPSPTMTAASLVGRINSHHHNNSESNPYEDRWYVDNNNENNGDLRVVPREVWDDMLAIVKAQVLSTVYNEYADAYLLRWLLPLVIWKSDLKLGSWWTPISYTAYT